MSEARILIKRIAVSILAREGIEAIWKLHVAAAEVHRTGHAGAAAAIVEIAEAAEHEWLSGREGLYSAGQQQTKAGLSGHIPAEPTHKIGQ